MPRYYFHVEDGRSYPDTDGTELSGLDEARVEATRMFGQMLAQDPTTFWNGDEWMMRVVDERQMTLFCVHFLATEAPAAPPSKLGLQAVKSA